MRFCPDFADEMALEGHTLGFVNMDAHTDEEKWPAGDFVGMGELNIDIQETDEVLLSFAIATKSDTNLFRMAELINELANRLMPNCSIPVYDSQTGTVISNLFVTNGVRIGAPMDTKTRALQPIMVRLLGDHRNL